MACNWLPLVSMTVCTRSEKLQTEKKTVFTSGKIRFHLPGWKVSLKQTFPLEEKNYYYLLITLMNSNSSKKAPTKTILFPQGEN